MTREAFIKELEEKGYPYSEEGNKIVVTHHANGGGVNLESLTSLPSGVVFKNGGSVDLESLKTLPPGVEFKNGGDVFLRSLILIKKGFLISGWFKDWPGNIEGIDNKSLLNLMIKQGVFI
jgi:hypothetical protein